MSLSAERSAAALQTADSEGVARITFQLFSEEPSDTVCHNTASTQDAQLLKFYMTGKPTTQHTTLQVLARISGDNEAVLQSALVTDLTAIGVDTSNIGVLSVDSSTETPATVYATHHPSPHTPFSTFSHSTGDSDDGVFSNTTSIILIASLLGVLLLCSVVIVVLYLRSKGRISRRVSETGDEECHDDFEDIEGNPRNRTPPQDVEYGAGAAPREGAPLPPPSPPQEQPHRSPTQEPQNPFDDIRAVQQAEAAVPVAAAAAAAAAPPAAAPRQKRPPRILTPEDPERSRSAHSLLQTHSFAPPSLSAGGLVHSRISSQGMGDSQVQHFPALAPPPPGPWRGATSPTSQEVAEMVKVIEVLRAKKAVQRQYASAAAAKGRTASRGGFEEEHAELLRIADAFKETLAYKKYKAHMRAASAAGRLPSPSNAVTDTSLDLDSEEHDLAALVGHRVEIGVKGAAIVDLVLQYTRRGSAREVTGDDMTSALLNIVMSTVRNMRSATETRLTPREVYVACPDLFRLYRTCHESRAYRQFRVERESLKKDSGHIKIRGHGFEIEVPYGAHLTVKDLKKAVSKARNYSMRKISLSFEGYDTLEPLNELVVSFGVYKSSVVQATISVSPESAWSGVGGISSPRKKISIEEANEREGLIVAGLSPEFIPVMSPASEGLPQPSHDVMLPSLGMHHDF